MYDPFRKIIGSLSSPPEEEMPGWPERVIKIDDTGFTVVETEDPENVRCNWASVREVFAYKEDLFFYDQICLGFRFDDSGHSWWVAESYIGYKALFDEMPRKFPGIRTEWYEDVGLSAFAENRTTPWGTTLPPVELPKPKRSVFW